MIFKCYFCDELMMNFNYFCPTCSDLRRMLLISNRFKLMKLIKSNLNNLVNSDDRIDTSNPPF